MEKQKKNVSKKPKSDKNGNTEKKNKLWDENSKTQKIKKVAWHWAENLQKTKIKIQQISKKYKNVNRDEKI